MSWSLNSSKGIYRGEVKASGVGARHEVAVLLVHWVLGRCCRATPGWRSGLKAARQQYDTRRGGQGVTRRALEQIESMREERDDTEARVPVQSPVQGHATIHSWKKPSVTVC